MYGERQNLDRQVYVDLVFVCVLNVERNLQWSLRAYNYNTHHSTMSFAVGWEQFDRVHGWLDYHSEIISFVSK